MEHLSQPPFLQIKERTFFNFRQTDPARDLRKETPKAHNAQHARNKAPFGAGPTGCEPSLATRQDLVTHRLARP